MKLGFGHKGTVYDTRRVVDRAEMCIIGESSVGVWSGCRSGDFSCGICWFSILLLIGAGTSMAAGVGYGDWDW